MKILIMNSINYQFNTNIPYQSSFLNFLIPSFFNFLTKRLSDRLKTFRVDFVLFNPDPHHPFGNTQHFCRLYQISFR